MGSYAVFLLRDLPCYAAFTVRCVWWAFDYAYHDDAIRNHGFCLHFPWWPLGSTWEVCPFEV